MSQPTAKAHWENIYSTKQPHEVSWTQENPRTSLDFIHRFNLPKSAPIIDIGGGDSKLADQLLEEGFEDVTVLDISETSLARAQQRLGEKSKKVHWIVADVTDFKPERKYLVWHDRAAFHFCVTPEKVIHYLATARQGISEGGFLTVGTFSTKGPKKCSGLEIRQYSEETLTEQLHEGFAKIQCITEDHETPFHTFQNFLFCSFKRTT